jgi:transcriptional regulator with XRE-family HTH domain
MDHQRYATQHIARTLKAARQAKKLSQRALSDRAGVPQGHISKIENGSVDLRLSSLVALGRVLDLELALVPRKTVSAVKSIVRSVERPAGGVEQTRSAFAELNRLQNAIADVARVHPAIKELAQLQRQVRDLSRFHLAAPQIEILRGATRAVQAFKSATKDLDAIRRSLSHIQHLRSALAHASATAPQAESPRPAYSLDEDDRG